MKAILSIFAFLVSLNARAEMLVTNFNPSDFESQKVGGSIGYIGERMGASLSLIFSGDYGYSDVNNNQEIPLDTYSNLGRKTVGPVIGFDFLYWFPISETWSSVLSAGPYMQTEARIERSNTNRELQARDKKIDVFAAGGASILAAVGSAADVRVGIDIHSARGLGLSLLVNF